MSPLKLASVAAAVANGGTAVEPFLFLDPRLDQKEKRRILKDSTAASLRAWMIDVVKKGTGSRAAVPGMIVGGKTGTAQNTIGDQKSHSWFIGFAYPAQIGPQDALAFAFLIENGGYGGRAAAQAAHDFILACSAPYRESNPREAR